MSDSVVSFCPHDAADLCILLLGKTGHGKSATGNTILGKRVFKASASAESVTSYAKVAFANVDGRTIKVVDTPGIGDTRLDTEEGGQLAIRAFNTGVSLCPDGFHGLVLVFKLGARMTDEEKYAIESLKEMLGENVIREYVVLLITHGDNYDEEEEEMAFTGWCQSQKGYMKELLQECGNRCVLFNNKSKDKDEQFRQRNKLLEYITDLKSKGKIYDNIIFEEARKTWDKLARQRKYASVIGKVDAGLFDISDDLKAVEGGKGYMDEPFFGRLREKLAGLRNLIANVEEPDKGRMEGQIKDMEMRIQSVQAQNNEESRKTQVNLLLKEIEDRKVEHQKQLQKCQEDFLKQQERMQSKMDQLMKEMRESEARMRAIPQPKKKKRCIIA